MTRVGPLVLECQRLLGIALRKSVPADASTIE